MPLRVNKEVSENARFTYKPFLFYQPLFLKQLKTSGLLSFYLESSTSGVILAEIHFVKSEDVAYSLPKGSFGSFAFSEDLDAEDLHFFVKNIEEQLLKSAIKQIAIRNFPVAYDSPAADKIKRVLTQCGYQQQYNDLNFHVDLIKDFAEGLKESESKRLNSLRNKGIWSEWWGNPDLDMTYNILLDSRKSRNYPMTMERQSFKEMFENLPGVYSVFRSVFEGQIIAIGVGVKISDHIYYNFYLGEVPEFRKYSPVVGLVECMAKYAKNKKYQLLDLGIATDKGVLNEGLARFKQNLGGIESDKIMFTKSL